jgi:DMSO reductase iron-sulfur subunit
MAQMSMVIDLDRCIGCESCTVACKQENNVRLGSFWTKVLKMGPYGKFPELEFYFLSVLCQHCKDPECIKVCPTGASHKREDGIVLIDKAKCIGCQYCAMACPYGVRSKNEDEGVVEKCTLCAHLVDIGEEPACVKTCIGKSRIFGDIDDPKSEVSLMIKGAGKNLHAFADVGNHPSMSYILSPRIAKWRSR